MAKKKKKTSEKRAKPANEQKEQSHNEDNELDFGGFPKDVSFKRNIGCGG